MLNSVEHREIVEIREEGFNEQGDQGDRGGRIRSKGQPRQESIKKAGLHSEQTDRSSLVSLIFLCVSP
jgi:hypothetical protein